MITITPTITLEDSDIEMQAIRAQGPGGQNVNKVSSAIHLRLDIPASSLPQEVKDTLLNTKDSRISNDGVFVLKAQNSRTQEQNREDAIVRLKAWIVSATKKTKTKEGNPHEPCGKSKTRRGQKATKCEKVYAEKSGYLSDFSLKYSSSATSFREMNGTFYVLMS